MISLAWDGVTLHTQHARMPHSSIAAAAVMQRSAAEPSAIPADDRRATAVPRMRWALERGHLKLHWERNAKMVDLQGIVAIWPDVIAVPFPVSPAGAPVV